MNAFKELLQAPIAYDMHVDIKTIRMCRPSRKGKRNTKAWNVRETVVMTSKQMAQIGAEAFMKYFNSNTLCIR